MNNNRNGETKTFTLLDGYDEWGREIHYCLYCGKEARPTTSDVYEDKRIWYECDCDMAIKERQLMKKINSAKDNIEKWENELKNLEISQDVFDMKLKDEIRKIRRYNESLKENK